MILDIGQGWVIDTALDETTGEPWADLWNGKRKAAYSGPLCIEKCLNDFRSLTEMDDDQINDWQREHHGKN